MSLYTFVNDASRSSVRLGLASIKASSLPNREFLPNSNRLKIDSAKAVQEHFRRNNPTRFTVDQANSYLATSSILHCFDGWNYLSRSIESLLNGESFVSIHLAYYAELRAAMTFLANEGIGIFDHKHFCVDTNNRIKESPDHHKLDRFNNYVNLNGTHVFLWEALNAWISNNSKQNSILNYFSHNGKSFDFWLKNIPNINSIGSYATVVRTWLKEWSFDLQEYVDDRKGRNTFSYRPTRLRDLTSINLEDKYNEIIGFWRLLEPDESNRFRLLDKYLFVMLFKRVHQQLARNGLQLTIEQTFDEMFTRAGKTIDIQLRNILLLPNDHPIIRWANNKVINPQTNYAEPMSIIARAILMLRVSSGAVANLFSDTRTRRNELDFYFELEGIELGFFDQTNINSSFTSLWATINDTLIEVEDWLNAPPPVINLKAYYEQQLEHKVYFPQFNRAAFWGTGF